MAALLGVLGEAPKTVPELLGEILEHERRFWRRELDRGDLLEEIELEEVDAVVAGLVLCNGARDRKRGRETVGRLLELSPKTPCVKKLVTILHRLYEGGGGAYIEPLQPDLLGEALVDVALEREPELLDRVLEEADDTIRERLLTVLTRLAQQEATATGQPGVRWLERALAGHLEKLAEPALQVILETGEPLGERLAAAIREAGPEELVRRLLRPFDAVGDWIAVAHREVAAAATERALELVPEDEEHDAERARLLNNLGNRLSDLGRREQALEATQEAVEIYRKLARQRPDAFLPDLAGSLNNLGSRLAGVGRLEEALEPTQEAVKIRRQLARQRPEAFLPDLATSLNNLGGDLADLGHREQALAVAEEAVRTLLPFFRGLPRAFADWMRTMLRNYLKLAEEAGQEPDVELVGEVEEIFAALEASD